MSVLYLKQRTNCSKFGLYFTISFMDVLAANLDTNIDFLTLLFNNHQIATRTISQLIGDCRRRNSNFWNRYILNSYACYHKGNKINLRTIFICKLHIFRTVLRDLFLMFLTFFQIKNLYFLQIVII